MSVFRNIPRFAFLLASVRRILLLFACFGVWAAPGGAADAKAQTASGLHRSAPLRVDSVKVHNLYLEGEFDAAIAILETNLKESRQYRHDDSVFIYKHLGIMYAAQIDTREKGKYYMHRLLTVEPTAKIMDMYASDMIYMIFRNIQDEFEQSRLSLGRQNRNRVRNDTVSALPDTRAKQDSAQSTRKIAAVPHSSSGKKWAWSGAAVATVAAGVGAYFLILDRQPGIVRKDYQY